MSMWTITLAFFLFLASCSGLRNITYDDDFDQIKYRGDWQDTLGNFTDLDFGGTHHFTTDIQANATLTFRGVAVYFMAPKSPETVSVLISLDSTSVYFIDLTDRSGAPGINQTIQSSVVWGATGLSYETHTVTIYPGDKHGIVDGFIVTVPEQSDSSKISSKKLAIALGVTLPVVCIAIIAAGIWLYLRARKQRHWKDEYRQTAVWNTPTRLWFDGQFITPETHAPLPRLSASSPPTSPPVPAMTAGHPTRSHRPAQSEELYPTSDVSRIGNANSSTGQSPTQRSLPNILRSESTTGRGPPPRYKSGIDGGRIKSPNVFRSPTRWSSPVRQETLPPPYIGDGTSNSDGKSSLHTESGKPSNSSDGPSTMTNLSTSPVILGAPKPTRSEVEPSPILRFFDRPRVSRGNPHRLSIV